MKTTIHMLLTLILIGCVSGGALSLVDGWASPLIQQGKEKAKNEAIGFLVPGDRVEAVREAAEGESFSAWKVFQGEELQGWVLRNKGTGFQDVVDVMIAVDPQGRELRGLKVLSDSETPGLGTWIRLDPTHAAALSESESRSLPELANDPKYYPLQYFGYGDGQHLAATGELSVVKGKRRNDLGPSEVQAITAATISSRSVVEIVNDALRQLRPLLAEGGRHE